MSQKIQLSNTKLRRILTVELVQTPRRTFSLTPKSHSLTVANLEQKIIFLYEMKQQISDGWWSNNKPYTLTDNVDLWSLSWDDVRIDPDKIGVSKNLKFVKNNYNFSSRPLLEQVGPRLRFKVALVKTYGDIIVHNMHRLPEGILEYMAWRVDNSSNYRALNEVGITEEMIVNTQRNLDEIYTMTDLRHDCKTLKMCIRRVR